MRAHAHRSGTPGARSASQTGAGPISNAPGRPLEPAVRGEMEAAFGHDFSHIRVHTDGAAAAAARRQRALAYTAGMRIVFAAGRYRPRTGEGRELLAHELAHTLQQPEPVGPAAAARPPSRRGEAVEREADRLAAAALAGPAATGAGAEPASLPRASATPGLTSPRQPPRLLRAEDPAAEPAAEEEVAPDEAEAAGKEEAEEADPMADFYDCDDDERRKIVEAVEGAKARAKEVADRLESFSRLRVRRHFRRIFGDKSEEARSSVLAVLRGVEKLPTTTHQAAAGKTTVFLGCAACGASAAAFYNQPEIVRSGPAHIETVEAPARLGFCSGFLESDSKLRNEADALHEMIHAVQNSHAVDVYYSSRLFESLGKIATAEGPAFATINPDSITAFVYFSLASWRGIGRGNLPSDEVEEIFPGPAKTVTSGFAGARRQREQARAALGLMETWVDVAEKRLGSLVSEIDGWVDPEWTYLSTRAKATAALLAGADVSPTGESLGCGRHPGFADSCPAADGPLGKAEAVFRREADRVALLRHRLSGKPTQEEVADAGGELDQLPKERAIRLRRSRRAAVASFKTGEDPDSGLDRPADKFRLPESFFSLPNLGEQAEVMLRLYADGLLAGGQVEPLVSFILRNAVRPDQASAAALGDLGAASL